ncbi:MAG: radical SAM protein [Chloroflexi bacterium]|nr:radical SAM protein [Chloroflexota bacterium]MCI0576596.1 radical SAM protein [Chloroflexota bacterium]MCI0647036.1 radical SAM protein [Chloroflexota bacterium]MCI0730736.1 radical SAM protein [Chloroflexota bacterium]
MNQQKLGNVHIGLREHSPLSPRYMGGALRRRLRQGLHLDFLWPAGWSPEPDMVCALPTYRCNLRCPFCFQRDREGRVRMEMKDEELTPDQWLKIIDQAASFTTTMFWMGGEIMIYPRIVELLAHCKAKGMRVIMITNGFHLVENVEKLVDIGVDAITVSLDGFEEVHSQIRRSPTSFKCVVEGVRAVVAARQARGSLLPLLTINHAMTQENYRQVSDFLDFARELGADIVQFIGLMFMSPETAGRHRQVMRDEFGVTNSNPDSMINGMDAAGVDAAWLQDEINRLLATAPASPTLRFCSLGLEHNIKAHYGPDEGLPIRKQRCTSLWRRMVIQPNGDVAMCYNQPEVVVGNAAREELAGIWNGDKFCSVRQRIRRELLPGCIRCGWLDYDSR